MDLMDWIYLQCHINSCFIQKKFVINKEGGDGDSWKGFKHRQICVPYNSKILRKKTRNLCEAYDFTSALILKIQIH